MVLTECCRVGLSLILNLVDPQMNETELPINVLQLCPFTAWPILDAAGHLFALWFPWTLSTDP